MTPNATSHTYTVSLEASSDIVFTAIHKFDRLNNKAKRAVCKCCRLSRNKNNSYYNISPLTSVVLLLIIRGDVRPNPGPTEEKRIYIPKHQCSRAKGAVELFRATPVASGHTTKLLVFSQMMRAMNSAAAVAYLHFCAVSVYFTPCRLLRTAIARLSWRKPTIFCRNRRWHRRSVYEWKTPWLWMFT